MIKNENIQVLRGLAILLVLLTHFSIILPADLAEYYNTHFLNYIRPSMGVDLFFVISGYLLGKTFLQKNILIKKTLESTLESTLLFYRKRFLRLMPAAYFWAFFTLCIGILFHDNLWLDKQSLIFNFFSSLTFIRNFSEFLKPTHLGYYWALAVEVQFYIFLPIVWFNLSRKSFWLLIFFYTYWDIFGDQEENYVGFLGTMVC